MTVVYTFCLVSTPYPTGSGNNSQKRQAKVKAYFGRQASDARKS